MNAPDGNIPAGSGSSSVSVPTNSVNCCVCHSYATSYLCSKCIRKWSETEIAGWKFTPFEVVDISMGIPVKIAPGLDVRSRS